MEWMPISTAPKDGTWMLAFRRVRGKTNIAQARWVRDMFGTYCFGGEGWYYPEDNAPTHWMPLPDPPKEPK